jgi:hypothetical protein
MMTIARAEGADVTDVLRLLNGAAAWLHERGIDQWPHGFTAGQIGPRVAMAEVWLVRGDDGQAAGTMRLTAEADPDFWTPAEAAEGALYVSGLAVDRARAGLGALMLRWAADHADQLGWRWLRLDARRDNAGLHRYYLERGWRHLRTVTAPGRFSGALFQIPAAADREARRAFGRYRPGGWLAAGDRVTVSGQGRGTVSSLYPPLPESGEAALYGLEPSAAPGYRVQLDNGCDILTERRYVKAL